MNLNHILLMPALLLVVSGCVRQQDLDSWVGQPVEALDTHSLFLTVPMVRTKTESGIEIRNYVNKKAISNCTGNATGNVNMDYASFSAFQNCSSDMVGCDNIFYIKDGKVLEYKPVGNCYTNETVQPERRRFSLDK